MSEGTIIHLDNSNFDRTINESTVPVIVDFWAPWCMPCLAMAPIFEELARRYKGKMIFAKVNVDENPDIANRQGIRGIPTFIIFKNGEVVDRIIGAIGRQLEEVIKKHIEG
ncbi:MAG: thioredoxin [Candidatus Odinarchaeia archaeon]